MQNREREIYRVTLLGTVVNAVLVVAKILAGIFGRSSALVADGIHSLSDFVTDIIVLVFVKLSGKPEDSDHGYGHGKYETLASMIIGLMLIGAGVVMLFHGISLVYGTLWGGVTLSRPAWPAMAVALLSVLSKEWLYRRTVAVGRRVGSTAVVANAWHHRSDALSSAGTLIGVGGAMFLGERWRVLDPLAAILVSVFIMRAGYEIFHPSMDELLEASLPKEDCDAIEAEALGIPGVDMVHRLRTRRIGNRIAIDLHCKMDGDMTLRRAHEIATLVEQRLKDKFGPATTIYIHMEPSRN